MSGHKKDQSEQDAVTEVVNLFDNINENTSDNSPTKGLFFNMIKNPLALAGTGVTFYFLGKAFAAGSGVKLRGMNEAFKGRIVAQFATIGIITGVFYIITRNKMSKSAEQAEFYRKAAWNEYVSKNS